jgi:two-component system sensor histidine kinase RpfC
VFLLKNKGGMLFAYTLMHKKQIEYTMTRLESLYRYLTHYTSNALNAFYNITQYKTKGNEYEQAVLRVIVITAILSYLSFFYDELKFQIPVFWGFCMAVSAFLLVNIYKKPQLNYYRVICCIFLDVGATTYSMHITDEVGSMLIAFYLWLIVGYGLRYGKRFLTFTTFLSICGFLYTTNTNPFWVDHKPFAYGLLVTLLVVPMYAFVLTQKLKKLTEKAEANSKAKSQFLSHISHEIRTPLNGIIGACGLIKASSEDQENLKIIRASAEHLTQLVTGVLDLAAIENGKTESKIVNFKLKDLVNDCLILCSANAKNKNLSLMSHIGDDLPAQYQGEYLQIKQVILNLLSNAIKFTDSGFVKINIEKLAQLNNTVKIKVEVTDSGIGIAPDAIGKIFDSFTQADDSIKYKFGGTGLGTTISKNLIEKMGGEMGVSSELGKGSTFWFELPLAIADVVDVAPIDNIVTLHEFNKSQNGVMSKYRILIADDAPINRTLLNKVLTAEGFDVDEVEDGQQALDKLETNQYDLIILDNNMPILNGVETIKIYHALQATEAVGPNTPIFIFSADATKEAMDTALEAGASAYLTKPIQTQVLKEKIYEALQDTKGKPTATIIDYNKATKELANNNAEELLDIERLDGLTNLFGNSDSIVRLINDFIQDTDKNLSVLDNHVKQLDYRFISEYGHTISGCAANLGATTLTEVCKKIESVDPTYQSAEIKKLSNMARETFNRTKVSYLDYINNLKQQTSKT